MFRFQKRFFPKEFAKLFTILTIGTGIHYVSHTLPVRELSDVLRTGLTKALSHKTFFEGCPGA
jgi:hypothetical protein